MQLFIEMGGRKGFAEQSLAVKVKVPWGGGMVGQWDGGMVSGDVFWAGWFWLDFFFGMFHHISYILTPTKS